jgi:diguanylate cyclase (GGDEF)-like protein
VTVEPFEAAQHDDETDRLTSLYQLDLLDSGQDERFDRIARIARRALDAQIALVTLLDHDEQQFCGSVGTELTGTRREDSFCTHAIVTPGNLLIVPDTLLDPRFADLPIVKSAPHIRCYAGAPITTPDGQPIGTLCVLDTEPRTFTADDEAVLHDLANLVEREILYTSFGMTDSLTGLPNRRAFMAAAERLIVLGRRRSESVAVIFADVNGLKRVNDQFGHVDGDALIRCAGSAISRPMRTSDIVARLGGDEFAVLLYDADASAAATVIDKINEQIAVENQDAAPHLTLSIALGAAIARPDDTVTDLIVRADAAMFEAKRTFKLGGHGPASNDIE